MPFYFDDTEGHQTWEVPAHVTEVSVALWGGGEPFESLLGTISDLEPGEILHFNLGGNPINSGWNGGGASAPAVAGGFWSSGGGGATDVRRGGNALSDRVIVAGGAAGMTSYFSPIPGFGDGPPSGPPDPGWAGSYWIYGYDRGDGVIEYRYETPGYVGTDGIPATGPYPISEYADGPAAPSGVNGADSVTMMYSSYGFLPVGVPAPPTNITVNLGAGGGGYTGGKGGELWYRQADPFFNPTRIHLLLSNIHNGAKGVSWSHPSVPSGLGPNRPGVPPETFFGQRILSGAIFVSWEETVASRYWNVGAIGRTWEAP